MTFDIVKTNLQSNLEKSAWSFLLQKRYILAFMVHLGVANMFIMRVNLSVTIVAMTEEGGKFNWSSIEQGIILSSFFYGYIITQLPGGILSRVYPAHHIFGGSIGLCALFTAITPHATFNLYALVLIRTLKGLALGVTYPALVGLIAIWAPPMERSRMTMICNSGLFTGTVVGMVGSGIINEYFGWEAVFYISGAIGIMWYLLWIAIIHESPETDPWITDTEKQYLQTSLGNSTRSNAPTPWGQILKSVPVWALIFAHFTQNWGNFTVMTQMPMFLSDTTDLDLSSTGFYSCLPYLASGLISIPAGLLSDIILKKQFLSTLNVRRSFTCVAFLIQSIAIIAPGYIEGAVASITALTITIAFTSVAMAGFRTNYFDIAPQFSMILFGLSNTINSLSGIVSPKLAGFIVRNKTIDEWKIIFCISSVIHLIGCLLYYFMSSAELQPWANIDNNVGDVEKKVSNTDSLDKLENNT